MLLPVIETERLVLRGWDDADAPALFTLASDPAIGAAAGWPPHRSEDESLDVIREVLRAWGSYAVVLRAPEPDAPVGALVGAIGLKDMRVSEVVERPDEFEVGYWIGRPFWGRGFATEALRALMVHARRNLRARRIWGAHCPENDRSRRVMEKCGLAFIREDGDVRVLATKAISDKI